MAGNEKLADNDQKRADIIDETVRDNAVLLDQRLRTIEKQNADELARFGPAPKPKATAKK